MTALLSDILVISIEQAVAAPYCTVRLADAGARVIKVERPEGDFARDYDTVVNGGSAHFDWLNRGKESVCLDFKTSDARLLRRMIDRADVFIQNLAPGAAERAGFGSASLREGNPRLITCDITGYGFDGPLRDRKAYDLLIQCESGLASITGTPDAPGRVGVAVADLTCGVNAYTGVLEALLIRERTGLGSSISVSLFDCMADWMAVPFLHHVYAGAAPTRVGIAHPSIVPYGVYCTKDGKDIVIAVQNEREWQSLLTQVLNSDLTLSDVSFASNSARTSRRAQVDEIIAGLFGSHSAAEMIARLENARVAFAVVNDVAGLACHPHLRRLTINTPEGPVTLPAPPVRWSGREISPGGVPKLGEHNDAVRKEFSALTGES